jgi:integrase
VDFHRLAGQRKQWEVIDFKNKTVTNKHKVTDAMVDGKLTIIQKDKLKTKSSNRTLPLLPQVEDRLLAEKARQKRNKKLCRKSWEENGYIFVNDLGRQIKPDYVSHHFATLLEKKGLRKVRYHDLRHSCASLLLSLGIPMKQIQDWLGHSNFSTTADLYAHLDYASKQISGDAIAGALGA